MSLNSDPRFWLNSGETSELVPAATVILVRDGAGGLETLMLRRNSTLDFAGGMWVFPGGRVDDADRDGAADDLHAARRAAVREAEEEAGLVVDEARARVDRALAAADRRAPPVRDLVLPGAGAGRRGEHRRRRDPRLGVDVARGRPRTGATRTRSSSRRRPG